MEDKDFPALYQSANDLSLNSQSQFFTALRFHLIALVVAAGSLNRKRYTLDCSRLAGLCSFSCFGMLCLSL